MRIADFELLIVLSRYRTELSDPAGLMTVPSNQNSYFRLSDPVTNSPAMATSAAAGTLRSIPLNVSASGPT
jgi:hypothetical protein